MFRLYRQLMNQMIDISREADRLTHTPQTAACMMASKPHSGKSILADTCCIAMISLNLSVLLVSDKPCLYPKVGKQVTVAPIPLKHSPSQ